jgi:hypothetical protein
MYLKLWLLWYYHMSNVRECHIIHVGEIKIERRWLMQTTTEIQDLYNY